MGSPFIDLQLLSYLGTGNITGTLDATGANTDALTTGVWLVWATENFYMQLNAASGTEFGAAPCAFPANYPVPVHIKKTTYLGIKRISTDGTYYATKVSGEV